MYYVIGVSVPSLHRESTDSLIHDMCGVDCAIFPNREYNYFCCCCIISCIDFVKSHCARESEMVWCMNHGLRTYVPVEL